MDPITHALSGALLYKTYSIFYDTPKTKWAVPLVMLATASPDLDVLFSLTPINYIANHRGISHSIIAAPFFAIFLALFMFPMWKKSIPEAWTFKETYAWGIILILLHIWLDVVTTYGTMIFMPISDYRVRLNGLFIIDLLLSLPMIFAFFWCRLLHLPKESLNRKFKSNMPTLLIKNIFHINKRQTVLIIVFVWILAYPATAVFWRLQLEEQQLNKFAIEDKKLLGLTVLADVFSPLNWRLIYSTKGIGKDVALKSYDKNFIRKYPLDSLENTAISKFLSQDTVYDQGLLYNGSTINLLNSFPAANQDLINMLTKLDKSCKIFFEFTLLPIQEITTWKNGFEFSFYDLRFRTLVPFAQKIMQKRNKNSKATFLLQVRLDKNAQLTSVRMHLAGLHLDSGWNRPDHIPYHLEKITR